MIQSLTINNFKCFHQIELRFGKLNVITGKNSSGKSSVIQALKLFYDNIDNLPEQGNSKVAIFEFSKPMPFADLKNKFTYTDSFSIGACTNGMWVTMFFYPTDSTNYVTEVYVDKTILNSEIEDTFPQIFHLPATRSSSKDYYGINGKPNNPLGSEGEYVIDYFYKHRKDEVSEFRRKETSASTLESQVNNWLQQLTLYSLKVVPNNERYEVFFVDSYGNSIRPSQVGTGIGFLAAVIIVCLAVPNNSIVIIENPEIHLHPSAQSELIEFLSLIAKSDVQVMVETHSDHIVNGVLVRLNEGTLVKDDVAMYFFDLEPDYEGNYIPINLKPTQDGRLEGAPEEFFNQIDIDMQALAGF